jgi:hypothetical protein
MEPGEGGLLNLDIPWSQERAGYCTWIFHGARRGRATEPGYSMEPGEGRVLYLDIPWSQERAGY